MDELVLLDITTRQADALREALIRSERVADADHRVLGSLRRRGLINDDNTVTDLGRYQVRWYADDAARQWGIETSTWHQYVKRGTAPPATAKGTFGSSVDRPWWDPRTVLEFVRPTSAHRAGTRTSALKDMSEVDAVAIIRAYRSGKASARALAAQYGVAPTTMISWLEERQEKPETTATRAERDRRMSANNPPILPDAGKRVLK